MTILKKCCCLTDRWRPCGNEDDSEDIFLPRIVKDEMGVGETVVKLDGATPCYFFVEPAAGTLTEYTTADYYADCDVAECDVAEYCDCPDICTDCPETLSVTISGLEGDCACINGTYDVPKKAGVECVWQVFKMQDEINNQCGVSITIECVCDQWQVTINAASLGDFFADAYFTGTKASQPCPNGLTFTATRTSGSGCNGQSATIAIAA